jgi:catechol 2,3-dioxygenase-like lactoylglutathione lyase family enzyme
MQLDHIGIVVSSLNEAEPLFGGVLRLPRDRVQNEPGRPDKSVFLRSGGVDIELIEVLDPIVRAERLRNERARIEHLAFVVPDLGMEIARLRRSGVRLSEPILLGGRWSAFTDPESSGGIMIQLAEQAVP